MPEGVQVRARPRRQEIPPEFRWRLEDIYPTEDAWEADFRLAGEEARQLAARRGSLGSGPEQLLATLQLRDRLAERLSRLYAYAHLSFDEDTTRAPAQARWQRVQQLATEVHAAAAFIEPEILALPPGTLQAFRDREPRLSVYDHYLDDLARQRPHTLPPEQEELLARAGELARTARNVYDLFADADLKFPVVHDEEGRPVELSQGRYLKLIRSRDRRVREETFRAFYGTFARYRHTLAGLLAASVRKDVFYARVRRHPSALAGALHADNVPPEVYTRLIDAVHQRLDALHRYLRLRRRLLQLDELHMYDLYVPVVDQVRFDLAYEEGTRLVQEALGPLGQEYTRVLREALTNRWVDVYENEGKTSGAYCSGVYGVHPYVLLNYQGTLNDVFAIAHEMGHALHDHFAYAAQPYVYAQPSIFVAEVASTLNELLLFHHLLQTTTDPRVRAYLINDYLDQVRGTVFRQVKFAEFEKIVHEKAEAGEALTPDTLNEIYLGLNETYYGAETVIDPEIAIEWARIPHFYTAFYVYKYATGFSAATALCRAILQEGTPAVERYLDFLRAGSSDYPLRLLQRAGVDLTRPDPVLQTLDEFEQRVRELEELTR